MTVIKDKVANRPNGVQPKYQWLKRRLLRELVSGQYAPGQAMPSENILAKKMCMARNTVRQALSELEQEGLICRIQGKGTFVNAVQNKAIGQQNVFAVILPEIRRSLYPSLVKGFDHGADGRHHRVMICNTDYDINKQGNIILQLIDRNVAGVAMVPTTNCPTPAHHIRQLQSNHIPVVFCHRKIPEVSAPLITWEWEEVGRIAARAFIERGHRHTAYVGVYRYPLTQAYERGFREILSTHGLTLSGNRICYGTQSGKQEADNDKRTKLMQMLQAEDRPTAVFCNDDVEAELVFYIAQKIGLKIPQELSIIGFGEKNRIGVIRGKLTLVTMNELKLGILAATLLHEMGTGQRLIEDSEKILIPLSLTSGETLGLAPE